MVVKSQHNIKNTYKNIARSAQNVRMAQQKTVQPGTKGIQQSTQNVKVLPKPYDLSRSTLQKTGILKSRLASNRNMPDTPQKKLNTSQSGKKTIVLDLDETLVHSEIGSSISPAIAKGADFHFQLNGEQYYVFKRPGLDAFLNFIFQNFDYVGFWTVGMACYAKNILKNILTLPQAQQNKMVFVFTRNKCHRDDKGYFKPLTTVWNFSKKFTPTNTIMIDNTPAVMRNNPQNGIVCPNYDLTNLKRDRYLPWLQDKMSKNLNTMKPLEFIQLANSMTQRGS